MVVVVEMAELLWVWGKRRVEVEKGRSRRGRQNEKVLGESSSVAETKETTLWERDMAEKEVEKLRNILRRQSKDLKVKMLEVLRKEVERKTMLNEHSTYKLVFWKPDAKKFS